MIRTVTAVILACIAAPALAEGDIDAGKKAFRKCKACHAVVTDTGDTIVKGGKTGPNLYGVAGRRAGTVEGFAYGKDLVAAGEAGLVWDEANFIEYAEDPRKFLKKTLGSGAAKSKMTFRLKKGANDIWAYLVSVTE